MDIATLKSRIQDLLKKTALPQVSIVEMTALEQGTLTVMRAMYGAASSQETVWRKTLDTIRVSTSFSFGPVQLNQANMIIRGALQSMLEEVDSGFIGSLRDSITGELLSDLVKLSRKVLEESPKENKDVAAVLAAAGFEDTIRRIAAKHSRPHCEKLADTLDDLKTQGHLQGAQVGIAQSYLSFRNKALHAKWDEVDLSAVGSVLAFTEQLLLKHFS
jgi:hypothetical protein